MRQNAFEVKTGRFALHYDEDAARSKPYATALEKLIAELLVMDENGKSCFESVANNGGVIDLVLMDEVPMRDITIWGNRIEQMFDQRLASLTTCPTCGTAMRPAGEHYVCEGCGHAA